MAVMIVEPSDAQSLSLGSSFGAEGGSMNRKGRTSTRLVAALSVAAALVQAGCGAHGPHGEPPEVLGEITETAALSGDGGLRIEVVDYDRDLSLIRVLGVSGPLAGKVLTYDRRRTTDRLSYQTKWHGRALYLLAKERDGRFRAYLPGTRDGVLLTYSEEKSAAIDAAALKRLHDAQRKRGELEALQRFDRAVEEADNDRALAEKSAQVGAVCARPLSMTVDWTSVSDTQILAYSVAGYCESALSALERLCESATGKRFAATLRGLSCRLDGNNQLVRTGDELAWNLQFDLANPSDVAYAALLAMTPDGASQTLGAQLVAEQTAVCSDADQKRVVLVGPKEGPHGGLAYGDGTRFYRVRTPEMLGSGWFFSPRHQNDAHAEDFRGLDLRLFSHVEPDLAKGTCTLACGTAQKQLMLVTGAAKEAILARAAFEPSPHRREPYALARDPHGTYYFVDRGNTPETARDFKLYRGKRGKLRPLVMKDLASDSEGEIFASKSGTLRLSVRGQTAQWTAGATSNLSLLPIGENLGLIYNELGVYLHERLGIPCDDF